MRRRETIFTKYFDNFYDAIDYTHNIDYEDVIKGYDVSSFEMTISHIVCGWVIEIKARKI